MTNCEWFDSKLEAYFCDDLAGDELRSFQAHLASCPDCRQQVEALKRIDPLVRGVMQHRLAVAQTAVHSNGRPRVFRLALAAGTLAAVVVLLVVGLRFTPQVPAPSSVASQPPAIESTVPPADQIKKVSPEETAINLGKPGNGTPVQPAPQPYLDNALANGPEFSITDAAGNTSTLETYRGRILLFGVVSPDQKAALSNLVQLYEAFGSNGRVGVLAVARHRTDEFGAPKFPLFFNNGSRLLGAGEGDFRLLDATGKLKLEGTLSDPASVAHIKSELGQLGIR